MSAPVDEQTILGVDLAAAVPCDGQVCAVPPRDADWRVILVPPCGCRHQGFACDPCRTRTVTSALYRQLMVRKCRYCHQWTLATVADVIRWEPLR